MFFFLGLACVSTGGVLAVQVGRQEGARKRIEMVSGLLLIAGLSLIGWGLRLRL